MGRNTYLVGNEPLTLLTEAGEISARGVMVHQKLMETCQLLGFQGMKRLHRIEAKCDYNAYLNYINYAIDMFDTTLSIEWENGVSTPRDIKSAIEMYLEWEINVYEELNRISNELTVKGYKAEAELVASHIQPVRKEIERCKRWLQKGNVSKWDIVYLLQCDKELHDKIKAIEEN